MAQYQEVARAPRNRKFFTRFHLTKAQTRVIGVAAQCIGGATSAVAVWALLGGLEAEPYKLRWTIAAFGGVAAAYLFQVIGVRAYLVRIIRQATRAEFENWKWVSMMVLNVIFFAAIFTADISTSFMARRVLLPQKSSTASAASADSAAILSASAAAMAEREADLAAAIAAVKATAATATQAAEQRAAAAVVELEKMKWGDASPATIATAKSKIAARQEALAGEIEIINGDAAAEITRLQNAHHRWEETHNAGTAAQLAAIGSAAKGKGSFATAAWGFTTLILVIAAALAVLFIIYEEIYFVGSEVDFETVPSQKENLFLLLMRGLYDRIYYALERFVMWAIRPPQPRAKGHEAPQLQPSQRVQIGGFTTASAQSQKPVTQKDTDVQPPTASAQYAAAQAAYLEMLREVRPNTVKSWYDRSYYSPEPRAATPEAQAANAAKYDAIKAKYGPRGIKFIEGKSLSIKF